MIRDHGLAHAHEAHAEAIGADALGSDAGALQQEMQFVGQHVGFVQSGGAAKLDELGALRHLEFLNDPPGGMIFFG